MTKDPKWTPEPWTTERPEPTYQSEGIFGADGVRVSGGCDREDGECSLNEEDKSRIVSCVNACANLPDPAAAIARWRRIEEVLANIHADGYPGEHIFRKGCTCSICAALAPVQQGKEG